MPATELLCHIIGVKSQHLTKEENILLEAELFYCLCHELKKIIKADFKNYIRLIRVDSEKEDAMIEANFMRCIINDILSTEAYTLSGIAFYTQTPEDIIYDLASGYNT